MGPLTGRVLDSNIVIDYLNGRAEAAEVLNGPAERFVSVVTWIEVLAGCRTELEDARARAVLRRCTVVPLTRDVSEEALRIRRAEGMKIPDAIILATARVLGSELLTRNTRDFKDIPGVTIPYGS